MIPKPGRTLKVAGIALAIGWGMAARPAAGQANEADEKLAKRIAKIDEKFLKTLVEFAKKYDTSRDPEAASFFAECAIGLGSRDEKVKAIKLGWELDVYLGKLQGGKPMADVDRVAKALWPIQKEYEAVIEQVAEKGQGDRQTLLGVALKYELARRADEYIRATKRVNEIRKGMKLRSVLWDFENSRKLILACAWWAETKGVGHSCDGHKPDDAEAASKARRSSFYDEAAEKFAGTEATHIQVCGGNSPVDWVLYLRGLALCRSNYLHPNARRLWLGYWWRQERGTSAAAYRIPLIPYREDIPTPTQRFAGETVVKDWLDTEEVLEVKGRKVPLAYYPFDGETDLPRSYEQPGEHPDEWEKGVGGWEESERQYLKGLPVMLRFFGNVELGEIEARLTYAASGKEIPSRVYASGDKRCPGIASWPTVLLVPGSELERGVKYTVTMKCKVDGVGFQREWGFMTWERP